MKLSHVAPAYHKYFTFTLKDYNQTRDKVKNYNPRNKKYESLIEEFSSILEASIEEIVYNTNRSLYFSHCIQNSTTTTPRALAKQCHTAVNALAFQYHIENFKALNLTHSQATECAKRFYIENYDAVNHKLAELLEETLQQTPLAPLYFID